MQDISPAPRVPRSRLNLAAWLVAIAYPILFLAAIWLFSSGTIVVTTPPPSALAPESLLWELSGPVAIGVAFLTQPGWPWVGRIVVGAMAVAIYLWIGFVMLITLSGAMGEPF